MTERLTIVQRYDMVEKVRGMEAWHELERADDGDWCRYEDVQAEIQRLRVENSELNAESLRVGAENMELRRELERLKAVTHDLVEAALRPADETAKCLTCGIPLPLQPGTAHWSGCPHSPHYDPAAEWTEVQK